MIILSLVVCGCASDKNKPANGTSTPASAKPSVSAPVSVTGTDWVLVRLGNDAALLHDAAGRPRFRLDGSDKRRVTGNTGVNMLNGTYELSGAALQFGPMITTRRAGAPELMQQESAFLKALEKTAKADLKGRSLTLRDAGGAALAEFEAMDVTP